MSITFKCLKCGKSIDISDKQLGRPVKCPHCHTVNKFTLRGSAKPLRELDKFTHKLADIDN